MSTKLPQDIDLNKLLETLEDSEEQTYSDSVLNFIAFYDLKPGEFQVKGTLLHELYKRWSKEDLKYITFKDKLAAILPTENKSHTLMFLINKNSLKLSEAAQKLLRKYSTHKHNFPSYKKHLESFLARYDIKSGKYWIEGYILYYLYDKWCYEIKRNTNRIAQPSLYNLFSLYFEVRRTKDNLFVGIDKSILQHITEEQMEQIRQGIKYARSKKKQKKQSQVSSLET